MPTKPRYRFSESEPGRRTVITLLCSIVIASLTSVSAHWGHGPWKGDSIWVANRDQGTVTVFDADTGEVVKPSPVTVGAGVHDLVVSHRTRKAFVTNDADRVFVLSASTLDVLDTIQFGAGTRPHHVELSPDGRTVYVGLFGTNRIAAIDVGTHGVREYASSTQTGPFAHAPHPSPDGRFIFVPHEMGNLITKLSARTGRILRSLSPGDTSSGQPSEVLSTRDGEVLYVSMRNEGKVKTVDVDSFVVTGEVSMGAADLQPESLILTRDERTLIVSLRGKPPARLAFVNTRNLTLRGTVDIGGAGTLGDLAVDSPDGRYVYATFDAGSGGQGGVARVDLDRGTVETWLYPGVGRPHGIAYSTDRLRID